MELIDKIKNCQTMRELDELRIEIVRAAENGEDFNSLQKAFIRKQNSLKRNGHSRWKEGYELQEIIKQQKTEGRIQ